MILAGAGVSAPVNDGTGRNTENRAFQHLRKLGNQVSSSENIHVSIDIDEKGTSASADHTHDSGTDEENLDVFGGLDWSVSVELPQ